MPNFPKIPWYWLLWGHIRQKLHHLALFLFSPCKSHCWGEKCHRYGLPHRVHKNVWLEWTDTEVIGARRLGDVIRMQTDNRWSSQETVDDEKIWQFAKEQGLFDERPIH